MTHPALSRPCLTWRNCIRPDSGRQDISAISTVGPRGTSNNHITARVYYNITARRNYCRNVDSFSWEVENTVLPVNMCMDFDPVQACDMYVINVTCYNVSPVSNNM